jgi:hypothetical protein
MLKPYQSPAIEGVVPPMCRPMPASRSRSSSRRRRAPLMVSLREATDEVNIHRTSVYCGTYTYRLYPYSTPTPIPSATLLLLLVLLLLLICSYVYSRCLPTPTPILQFLHRCAEEITELQPGALPLRGPRGTIFVSSARQSPRAEGANAQGGRREPGGAGMPRGRPPDRGKH